MRGLPGFTAIVLAIFALPALSDDAGFLKTLAEGNRAEIEAGELAGDKASNDVVRDFGMMLVKDHGAALEKVQNLAKSKNVDLPETLGEEKTAMLNKLRRQAAPGFDSIFMAEMVKAHEKTVGLLKEHIASGSRQTKALAQELLPTVQSHLREAYRLTGQEDKAASMSSTGGRPR
jgi:putative membrane protein